MCVSAQSGMMRGAESCICLPQRHAGDSIRSDDDIEGLSNSVRFNLALWTGPVATHNPFVGSQSFCTACHLWVRLSPRFRRDERL
jgi:hypothetical protein